ncbi:MAG: thiamine phosphate synthase, partial [Pseudomonadota bacterium]
IRVDRACEIRIRSDQQSKSAGRPLGVSRFRSLVANSALPIYGLGGVSPKNAAQLSGIAGIAAVSAFAD